MVNVTFARSELNSAVCTFVIEEFTHSFLFGFVWFRIHEQPEASSHEVLDWAGVRFKGAFSVCGANMS